ncbi:hypothetical protein HDV64DRAFT_219649 [Trichoderma sp. TUCIM 5745]
MMPFFGRLGAQVFLASDVLIFFFLFAVSGSLFCLSDFFFFFCIFSAISPRHYPLRPPPCHRSSSAKTSLTGSPRGNFCTKGGRGGRSNMYRATVLYRQGSEIPTLVWYKLRLGHAPLVALWSLMMEVVEMKSFDSPSSVLLPSFLLGPPPTVRSSSANSSRLDTRYFAAPPS